MPAQSNFDLWTTLVFPDRSVIAQGFTVETHSGDIYATQDGPDGLLITRFVDFQPVETMEIPGGGHGDLTFDVELVEGDICPSFIDDKGRLRRIPFQAGRVSLSSAKILARGDLPIRGHDGTVLVRRTVAGGPMDPVQHFYGPAKIGRGQGTVAALKMATKRYFRQRRYGWQQGIAFHRYPDRDGEPDGRLFTLYGTPFITSGPLYSNANIPARIEVRQAFADPAGEILDRIKIDQLGRDDDGDPIDSKIEPEGLAVAILEDKPHLLVGISTGTHAHHNYSLTLWKRAL